MWVTRIEFTFGERLGLAFIVLSSCLSIASILVLLAYVAVLAIRRRRHSDHYRNLLHHGADYYILSLFGFDIIQSAGHVMHIAWIQQAGVISGPYCTAQGAIQHVGNVGVALTTLAIGVTSFAVVVLRWKNSASRTIPILIHTGIIVLLILFTVIPAQTRPEFYAPTGYWCWISPQYRAEQIALEYGWFWLASLINFLLYVLIFLTLRGNLQVDFGSVAVDGWGRGPMRVHWVWKRNRQQGSASVGTSEERTRLMRTARRLLAYPIAYIITILPMSIVRWIQFTQPHRNIPSSAVALAAIIYTSSGFINVCLYVITHWRFLTRSNERQTAPVIEVTMKSGSQGIDLPNLRLDDDSDDASEDLADGHPPVVNSYSMGGGSFPDSFQTRMT
ncbi:hypothetical protein FRB94_006665 [Tulasnella sp. JGI-2019a]|nr:hypothetical protein FRB93_006436 [Tulasnella sp. JGI-2019a]KAG8998775.1 hypothetical protein FRB94_006665 [Tulasnella sp. JGI-2019a]KAG9029004.1 hypothetical protein FRB95_005824 [Tulasnella sp. JGI-2019a]